MKDYLDVLQEKIISLIKENKELRKEIEEIKSNSDRAGSYQEPVSQGVQNGGNFTTEQLKIIGDAVEIWLRVDTRIIDKETRQELPNAILDKYPNSKNLIERL